MRNKIIILSATALIAFGASSCNKWLDVNTNPNITQNANVELILPSAEVGISTVLGNPEFLVNGGFWAQYWTQSPSSSQFKFYDQFQTNADDYNTTWSYAYAYCLQDLVKLEAKATSENKTQYVAIAKILQAYMYQLVTDAWGDAPFKDALKGAIGTSPKYDNQAGIYDAIITMVGDATSLIDPTSSVHPTKDDLLFGGDMVKWYKFANSLKLKMAMRLSEVNPAKAETIIKGLEADQAEFLDEDLKISYSATGGNENPYYSFCIGVGNTQNIYGSATCMNAMATRNDPRISVFYNQSANGSYQGIPQGEYDNNDPVFLDGVCNPSAFVGADPSDAESAKAPIILMSVAESNFLLAEAAARGWYTATDAQTNYQNGVLASMSYCQIASADAMAYLEDVKNAFPSAGNPSDKIKAIIDQKYFSMCGTQGFEAWTEWRRTGYPDFFVRPKFSVLAPNEWPARYLYPSNEKTLNANFPGSKEITVKVWWDKN
jgi:Starch-binding associating with outer membrane